MKKKMLEPITRAELLDLFSKIDELLVRKKKSMEVLSLGGVAIIMQEIRQRATLDIDIANTTDAESFQQICNSLDVQVDIVTIVSTVDLVRADRVMVFQGVNLTVYAITPEDLIRLKLERFRKHDAEDIYAIIAKIGLPYHAYQALVEDMLPDFVGNPRELLLSAYIVVEQVYAEHAKTFEQFMKKKGMILQNT